MPHAMQIREEGAHEVSERHSGYIAWCIKHGLYPQAVLYLIQGSKVPGRGGDREDVRSLKVDERVQRCR